MSFAGLFLGEGMIRISKDKIRSGRNRQGEYKPWFRPQIRVTVRKDDNAMIEWIRDTIGGHTWRTNVVAKVYNKKTGQFTYSNPHSSWQCEDASGCRKVCEMVLACPIPSKKKPQAEVMLEFLDLKEKHFKYGKPYELEILKQFEDMADKISALKKFNE